VILAEKIEVTANSLKLIAHMPEAVEGVVPFINQFTKLWIGTIQKDFFISTFLGLKSQVLPWLADLDIIEDNDNYRIGHKLELCHTALESKWNSPTTATVVDGDIFWESGQSRLIAGALCWQRPWQQCQLLVFSSDKPMLEHWLTDAVEITSDSELSKHLGSTVVHKINTRFDVDHIGRISLRIGSVTKDTLSTENKPALAKRVSVLREWIKLYPLGTQLDVYTDHPELIKDSIGYWKINYFSSTADKSTGKNYKFYVHNPAQVVDIAELLFWMDIAYTEYITKDSRYILRLPNNLVKTKTIGLSYCNT